MYKLSGNTAYEKVSTARGKLAGKLMNLIDKHGEDARVYQLATEYVIWWDLPFNDGKDAAGRDLWDKVDALMDVLENETSASANVTIGMYIGRAAGVTVNATNKATNKATKWFKKTGVPIVNGLCLAVKDGYNQARNQQTSNTDSDANTQPEQPTTQQSNDDDSPY